MFANSLFDFELASVALAKYYSWVSKRLIRSAAFKREPAAVSHLVTFRSVLGSLMTAAGQRAMSARTRRVTGQPRATTVSALRGMLGQCWLRGERSTHQTRGSVKVLCELGPLFMKWLHPCSHFHPFSRRVVWRFPNLNLWQWNQKGDWFAWQISKTFMVFLLQFWKCFYVYICVYTHKYNLTFALQIIKSPVTVTF